MADEKLKRAIFEALSPEYDMVSEYSEHAFSDKFEKNMQKLIARQKKPYYSMINTVGKRAACVILAVLIAFTAAVLNVEALRTAFRDFFVNIFEKFSIVQSADENKSPETIEDIYVIAYNLSGFTEEVWADTEFDRRTEYVKGDCHIDFEQSVKKAFNSRLNTESADVLTVVVGGHEAMYYRDNHNYDTVTWDNGDYIFVLSGNIGKDELIKLAESVQKAE